MEALKGHLTKTLRYPEDLAALFGDPRVMPTVTPPVEPPLPATITTQIIWGEEVKEFVKRTRQLRSNMASAHATIWGQCSEEMRAKLKTNTAFRDKNDNNDCVWLL